MNLKKCKNTIQIFLAILIPVAGILYPIGDMKIHADEIDDIQKQIDEQNKAIGDIQKSIEDSKKQIDDLSVRKGGLYAEYGEIKKKLDAIGAQIKVNEDSINALSGDIESAQNLSVQQEKNKNEKVRSLYIDYKTSSADYLLSAKSFSQATRLIVYKELGTQKNKENILQIESQLTQLNKNLEDSKFLQSELNSLNSQLSESLKSVQTQIAGVGNKISAEQRKQSSLSSQLKDTEALIGQLTAKQKELIAARIAAANQELRLTENTPVTKAIPEAPFADGFAVASYGAPHRVGLNQYGALGRANDGQKHDEILKAYFANVEIIDYSELENIYVKGTDEQGRYIDETMAFEDKYMKGIAEMPSSWPLEAQMAQAILARTYAIKITNNGANFILPNQSNQVYNQDKVTNTAASIWHEAVSLTRGKVLAYQGQPITAWYSSTAGGYTKLPTEVGWYSNPAWVKSIKDYGANGAYDGPSYGQSPWYHMVWGGVSDSWGSGSGLPPCYYRKDCQPWLTNKQMQDIFNVILLTDKSGDEYNAHLSPVNWGDAETWSEDQVAAKLQELGVTPVGVIESITTFENSNSGDTVKIVVKSSGYTVLEFDAQKFKSIFYMRSPGTLVIRSSRFDFISS